MNLSAISRIKFHSPEGKFKAFSLGKNNLRVPGKAELIPKLGNLGSFSLAGEIPALDPSGATIGFLYPPHFCSALGQGYPTLSNPSREGKSREGKAERKTKEGKTKEGQTREGKADREKQRENQRGKTRERKTRGKSREGNQREKQRANPTVPLPKRILRISCSSSVAPDLTGASGSAALKNNPKTAPIP